MQCRSEAVSSSSRGGRTETYNTECADEFLRRLGADDDDHLHEVAADADDNDHAEGLEDADKEEHLAQRHGTVAGDRHIGGCCEGFEGIYEGFCETVKSIWREKDWMRSTLFVKTEINEMKEI